MLIYIKNGCDKVKENYLNEFLEKENEELKVFYPRNFLLFDVIILLFIIFSNQLVFISFSKKTPIIKLSVL